RDFHVTGVQTCALPISDPDGETIHDLATAPRAVLARILEIRRNERERVPMKSEVLAVCDRGTAAGRPEPRHLRAVRDRCGHVLEIGRASCRARVEGLVG